MSKLQQKLNYVITQELYEQYAEKCRLPDKKVTLRCLLLQLGFDPSKTSCQINGQFVFGFESIFVEPEQTLNIVPIVAGG
jgi:sulfur carrier protein ThiS